MYGELACIHFCSFFFTPKKYLDSPGDVTRRNPGEYAKKKMTHPGKICVNHSIKIKLSSMFSVKHSTDWYFSVKENAFYKTSSSFFDNDIQWYLGVAWKNFLTTSV